MRRLLLHSDRFDALSDDAAVTALTTVSSDPNDVHVVAGTVRLATVPRRLTDELNVTIGQRADAELHDRLRTAIDVERLERIAMRLLGRREHSAHQLRTKLERSDMSSPVIDSVMQRLLGAGWIDDDRAAAHIVAEETRRTPAGVARIRDALQRRGIDGDAAERAIEAHCTDRDPRQDARAVAERVLQSLRQREDTPEALCRKVAARLARRGFDPDTIETVLNDLDLIPQDLGGSGHDFGI